MEISSFKGEKGANGDFGGFGVFWGMRKKVCSHDFGLLLSVLEGFGGIWRPWWPFLAARKRALEASVTVTWPTMGKCGDFGVFGGA